MPETPSGSLVFACILCSLKGLTSVASQGGESEKHRLENTVLEILGSGTWVVETTRNGRF